MQKAHLHLIKWAVKRGYSVAVFGEGEYDGVHHTYKEIKDNVEACDMGEMVLLTPSVKQEGKWKRLASFAYVFEYEQEPDESIYDYGVNEISEAWAAEYETTHQLAYSSHWRQWLLLNQLNKQRDTIMRNTTAKQRRNAKALKANLLGLGLFVLAMIPLTMFAYVGGQLIAGV